MPGTIALVLIVNALLLAAMIGFVATQPDESECDPTSMSQM
jgi:hypothetical protein